MMRELVTIDPKKAKIFSQMDMLANPLYQFCSDDPMTDRSTYRKFEYGPHYVLDSGSTIRMDYLWGWDENDQMTEPKDYQITLPKESTVKYAVAILMCEYHNDVENGRYYYVEAIVKKEDGTFVVYLGT